MRPNIERQRSDDRDDSTAARDAIWDNYVENVGDTDLQFIGVFRAPRYEEISLSNWLTHTPPALVAQHLNLDEVAIAKWPDNGPGVMPNS
jgi:oxalate decarboxylase